MSPKVNSNCKWAVICNYLSILDFEVAWIIINLQGNLLLVEADQSLKNISKLSKNRNYHPTISSELFFKLYNMTYNKKIVIV